MLLLTSARHSAITLTEGILSHFARFYKAQRVIILPILLRARNEPIFVTERLCLFFVWGLYYCKRGGGVWTVHHECKEEVRLKSLILSEIEVVRTDYGEWAMGDGV